LLQYVIKIYIFGPIFLFFSKNCDFPFSVVAMHLSVFCFVELGGLFSFLSTKNSSPLLKLFPIVFELQRLDTSKEVLIVEAVLSMEEQK
jgi:hypothetical protein